MPQNPTEPKTAAAEAYNHTDLEVGQLVSWLQDQRDTHKEFVAIDGIDWIRVAELQRVRATLLDLIAEFAQQDREDLKSQLADL